MELQEQIEHTISSRMPEVEVLLVERPSPGVVRVVIDRATAPVDTDLCERVTYELAPVRTRYALEVSSPGADRPLTKASHYQRFLGRRVSVQTVEAIEDQRNFRGGLTAATEDEIEIDQDGRPVRIPLRMIRRSRLVVE
jgi:ribosome maturation factor RimP